MIEIQKVKLLKKGSVVLSVVFNVKCLCSSKFCCISISRETRNYSCLPVAIACQACQTGQLVPNPLRCMKDRYVQSKCGIFPNKKFSKLAIFDDNCLIALFCIILQQGCKCIRRLGKLALKDALACCFTNEKKMGVSTPICKITVQLTTKLKNNATNTIIASTLGLLHSLSPWK